MLSPSEDGEGGFIEVPTCDESYSLFLAETVFAVGFPLGVGSVICFNPFSAGFVGLASGRIGTGIAGYAAGRSCRDPWDIDVSLGSDGGGSAQFDLDAPQRSSLDPEDW